MPPRTQARLSPFGQYVRKLRIDHDQSMQEMAETCLGVTKAFLSATETGVRKPPVDWTDKIAAYYRLSKEEAAELAYLIDVTREPRLDVSELSPVDQQTVRDFVAYLHLPDDTPGLTAFDKDTRAAVRTWMSSMRRRGLISYRRD